MPTHPHSELSGLKNFLEIPYDELEALNLEAADAADADIAVDVPQAALGVCHAHADVGAVPS